VGVPLEKKFLGFKLKESPCPIGGGKEFEISLLTKKSYQPSWDSIAN